MWLAWWCWWFGPCAVLARQRVVSRVDGAYPPRKLPKRVTPRVRSAAKNISRSSRTWEISPGQKRSNKDDRNGIGNDRRDAPLLDRLDRPGGAPGTRSLPLPT